jgi:hypothetical protein
MVSEEKLMIEFHPLANIFPLVEGQEFAELVADIREHGLHKPIVVYEDKILDGRNRYRACLAADIECRFETYQGDESLSDPLCRSSISIRAPVFGIA